MTRAPQYGRRNVSQAQQRNRLDGMAWWNGLPEIERSHWMRLARNTGNATDAWAEFKRAMCSCEDVTG